MSLFKIEEVFRIIVTVTNKKISNKDSVNDSDFLLIFTLDWILLNDLSIRKAY